MPKPGCVSACFEKKPPVASPDLAALRQILAAAGLESRDLEAQLVDWKRQSGADGRPEPAGPPAER